MGSFGATASIGHRGRARFGLVLLLLVLLWTASPAPASAARAPVEARLSVKGMVCPNCEKTVESILNGVDGVSGADADRRTRTAVVTFDPGRTSTREMARAINTETYYSAKALPGQRPVRAAAVPAATPAASGRDEGSMYLPLALGAAALALMLLLFAFRRRRQGRRSPGTPRPETN